MFEDPFDNRRFRDTPRRGAGTGPVGVWDVGGEVRGGWTCGPVGSNAEYLRNTVQSLIGQGLGVSLLPALALHAGRRQDVAVARQLAPDLRGPRRPSAAGPGPALAAGPVPFS